MGQRGLEGVWDRPGGGQPPDAAARKEASLPRGLLAVMAKNTITISLTTHEFVFIQWRLRQACLRRSCGGVAPGGHTARVRYYPELPAQRNRAILGDLIVVALVLFFAWLGVTVNDTFDEIASLGRGVKDAGNSVQGGFEDAGSRVADVPIVGGALDDAFTEIGTQSGGNTAALGERGESAIEDTARLLGWVTFALPTLLVLLWAVPRRIARVRRFSAAARLLGDARSGERRNLLAMRAAFSLPYETLLSYTPDPIGALAEGDNEPLLRALFEDSGLRPPEPTQP